MKTLLLNNCKIFDQKGLVNLFIRDGKIEEISSSLQNNAADKIIDIAGKTLVPGFIDLHIHGAGGGEAFSGEISELKKMTAMLTSKGVTGIVPTTIVSSENDYQQLRKLNNVLEELKDQSGILGLHLEGPFINPVKKGGIPSQAICEYDRKKLLKIIQILGNNLKMMTIAPEISPNMEIIDILLDHNIVPSLGHTDISYSDAHLAFDKGVRHVTHIFNAMPPLHHRNPGPLLAIFERKDITVQIISDGTHLNPAIVRYLYHTLGVDNCVCVSDGQSVIGLPDGKYEINGGIYQKTGEKATDLDGNLIGSALDVGTIGRYFKNFTQCSPIEAFQTISINPAKVLNIDNDFGSITKGKNADLVVINEDMTPNRVILRGKIIQS